MSEDREEFEREVLDSVYEALQERFGVSRKRLEKVFEYEITYVKDEE